MPRPSTHPLHAAQDIAAVLGAMICALLAALFGPAGTRARGRAERFPDVMTGVLRAMDEAEFAYEPEVEWVMVPAPWRNGRLLPRAHARRLVAFELLRARPGALVHGPPAPLSALISPLPGIA